MSSYNTKQNNPAQINFKQYDNEKNDIMLSKIWFSLMPLCIQQYDPEQTKFTLMSSVLLYVSLLCHFGLCHSAACHLESFNLLSVILLSIILLDVILLYVILPSLIWLNVMVLSNNLLKIILLCVILLLVILQFVIWLSVPL